jgi:hypothetical protein
MAGHVLVVQVVSRIDSTIAYVPQLLIFSVDDNFFKRFARLAVMSSSFRILAKIKKQILIQQQA